MDHGYDAILCGDTLQWIGERPSESASNEPVHVRIITQATPPISEEERKRQLGAALNALVKSNPFREIHDPVEWQREIRADRALPGRDE